MRPSAVAAVSLLLLGCVARTTPPSSRIAVLVADDSARALAMADEYVTRNFAAHPEDATFADFPDADHGAVTDVSPTALRRWRAYEDDVSARLHAIDPSRLTERARLSRAIVLEEVDANRQLRVCRSELWEVRTIWSWQSIAAELAEIQPVGTLARRAGALARLRGFSRMVDVRVENLREGLRLGYAANGENVAAAVAQVDAILVTPLLDSPFESPAVRDGDPAFRRDLEHVLATEFLPALRRYRDFLSAEYAPRAREQPGVNALPGGTACYQAAVRQAVTVDVSAEEIHEEGLAEMARVRGRMQAIAERSFGTRDVAAVLAKLRTDPKWQYRSSEEIVATARAAIDRAWAAVPRWFTRVPPARVRVQPYEDFRRSSAPVDSYIPPTTGSGGEGIYQVNAFVPPSRSRAGLESTAFHEAVPGHHLQLALAKETADVPVARWIGNTAYVEGWAVYAEGLAEEMGLFSGDVDLMGQLSNQALRAARLVVDSGMHALGWSRQQAIDYLLQNTTLSPARAASELNRYSAVPGQAVAYFLGAREIRRLRHETERALGPRFDVRAFHNVVLGAGVLPLPALRERVGAWVAAAETIR